jgi:LmbE family N-acetylglucosaminyl deacetylase
MTILIVAAHPDDETLGCGGTVAQHTADGHEVHIAILGEGISSRHRRRDEAPAAELDKLRRDAEAAASALGAR